MIFVYPTETCYGLGCSIFDEKGIKRVYELKKRDPSKPLIVLVKSIKMWKTIAKVNKKALELAEKHWPGPLTIIQPKKSIVPDVLSKDEIGVRISSHIFPGKLIRQLKAPIVSTSANLSRGSNPYKISDIPQSIIDNVDEVYDAGELEHNPPSTVVRVTGKEVKVLRKGDVTL